MPLNIPNAITLLRLAAAAALCAVLEGFDPGQAATRYTLAAAFWLFVLAATTDLVDGWLARAWGQESRFGRVMDPLVDKVLVCGALAYLCSGRFTDPDGQRFDLLRPWMLALVVLRELLVSGLRADSEAAGRAFGAVWSGKAKMLVQSITVGVILGHLAWFPQLRQVAQALIWSMVVLTAVSGVPYVLQARRAASEGA